MKKVLGLAVSTAMILSVVISSVASAAPLYCPDDQYADKVDGGWVCVNRGGGNAEGAGWHKGTGNKYP